MQTAYRNVRAESVAGSAIKMRQGRAELKGIGKGEKKGKKSANRERHNKEEHIKQNIQLPRRKYPNGIVRARRPDRTGPCVVISTHRISLGEQG